MEGITAIRERGASASIDFQRVLGSSAKTNTGLRKNGRMDMRKLGVLPRGSNALETTRWVPNDNS